MRWRDRLAVHARLFAVSGCLFFPASLPCSEVKIVRCPIAEISCNGASRNASIWGRYQAKRIAIGRWPVPLEHGAAFDNIAQLGVYNPSLNLSRENFQFWNPIEIHGHWRGKCFPRSDNRDPRNGVRRKRYSLGHSAFSKEQYPSLRYGILGRSFALVYEVQHQSETWFSWVADQHVDNRKWLSVIEDKYRPLNRMNGLIAGLIHQERYQRVSTNEDHRYDANPEFYFISHAVVGSALGVCLVWWGMSGINRGSRRCWLRSIAVVAGAYLAGGSLILLLLWL
jgi:hypothetical protein